MANAKKEHDAENCTIFTAWKAYEEIAMHFNDMLLRLRIQALAGVAALAVLASVFSNVRTFNFQGTWLIASAAFFGLMLVWIAIWLLDRTYYTRLLMGSVDALLALEALSKEGKPLGSIDLSSRIDNCVRAKKTVKHPRGVCSFYLIVFITLFIGFGVTTRAALTFKLEPRLSSDSSATPTTN